MFERSVPVIDDQAEGWAPSIIDRVLRERESNAQRLEITLDLRSAEQILSSWRDEDVLFYLASRNQSEIVVASGISDQIFLDGERSRKEIVASIAEIEARAEDGARYYGGLRFDPFTDSDEEWRPFGTINFIKPRFEVRIGRGATVLLVNEGSVEDLSQAMDGWSFDDRPCNGRNEVGASHSRTKLGAHARLQVTARREEHLRGFTGNINRLREAGQCLNNASAHHFVLASFLIAGQKIIEQLCIILHGDAARPCAGDSLASELAATSLQQSFRSRRNKLRAGLRPKQKMIT